MESINYRFLLLFLITLLSVISCADRNKPIEFIYYEKESGVEKKDSAIVSGSGFVFFVRNYKDDTNTLLAIYEFIEKIKREHPPAETQGTYEISFYRESGKTNLEHLAKNPRDFDRHSFSHDLKYIFKWHDGKFLILWHYRNGKVVYPPDDGSVTLHEPPPLENE